MQSFPFHSGAEWDASDWTRKLLECVSASERKLRLLVCETARQSFPACHAPEFITGLTWAEDWADSGRIPPGVPALERYFTLLPGQWHKENAWVAAVRQCFAEPIGSVFWWEWADHDPVAADATRELFANPFVPLEWQPEWLTSTVHALASHIYESRDFATMPILGDALMDAGCDHQLIQEHCHSTKPHARGCWVVDMLLGKV